MDETEFLSESQEARIDAGDRLDDDLRCAFVTHDTHPERGPCAQEATTVRPVEGVDLPACAHHAQRGGILHGESRRLLVRRLADRGDLERSRVAVTDEGERVTFPNFCSRCGARLFTGNTSSVCSDCAVVAYEDVVFGSWPAQATATPPRFPFEVDRFVYEAPSMAAWRAAHIR